MPPPNDQPASRARSTALFVFACAGWAAVGLWRRHVEPVAFDDSFISYHYARSVAEGHGFVFNAEDGPVEGFTNLAWVVILAIGARCGAAPEVAAPVLGLACYALSFAAFACLFLRAKSPPLALVAIAMLVGTLAVPDGLAAMAGSGLETPLLALLTVALALCLDVDAPSPRAAATAVACQVALVMTRMDAGIFAAAFGIVGCWQVYGAERSARAALRWTLRFEAPALAVIAALLLWKASYFGDWLPNTAYAKSASIPSWALGWAYWKAFAANSPQIFVLVGLAAVGCLPGQLAGVARYAALGAVLFAVYCARVGGDFMYYRFAFEAYPLVVLAAAIGALHLATEARRSIAYPAAACLLAACALGLSTTAPVYEPRYGMQSMRGMNDLVVVGTEVGRRLDRVLPRDARIATTLAGTIPYYARRFTVDQWGLNDTHVAHLRDRPYTSRGHVKGAPQQYLRDRRVNLVIDHPFVCSCRDRCDDGQPAVYVRLDGDRCLRTRYLVRRPDLTALFCTSPAFVASAIDCREPVPPYLPGANEQAATPLSDDAYDTLVAEEKPLQTWHLDGAGEPVTVGGTAWGSTVTLAALRGQTAVSGQRGRGFLDSFHDGDVSRGVARVDLPAGTTQVAVRVGGGSDCAHVYAAVVCGDTVLSRACGDDRETFRAFRLDATGCPTSTAFVAVDDATGPWGHLLVDEVVALRAP